MYKALIGMMDGEGNHQYASPPGEENLTHATQEQAAQHLLENFGKGLITTINGEYVNHV